MWQKKEIKSLENGIFWIRYFVNGRGFVPFKRKVVNGTLLADLPFVVDGVWVHETDMHPNDVEAIYKLKDLSSTFNEDEKKESIYYFGRWIRELSLESFDQEYFSNSDNFANNESQVNPEILMCLDTIDSCVFTGDTFSNEINGEKSKAYLVSIMEDLSKIIT